MPLTRSRTCTKLVAKAVARVLDDSHSNLQSHIEKQCRKPISLPQSFENIESVGVPIKVAFTSPRSLSLNPNSFIPTNRRAIPYERSLQSKPFKFNNFYKRQKSYLSFFLKLLQGRFLRTRLFHSGQAQKNNFTENSEFLQNSSNSRKPKCLFLLVYKWFYFLFFVFYTNDGLWTSA